MFYNVTGINKLPAILDDQSAKTINDKLIQKTTKDINTTESCWNTTISSLKATNSSGLYLHYGIETKYLCGITKNKII